MAADMTIRVRNYFTVLNEIYKLKVDHILQVEVKSLREIQKFMNDRHNRKSQRTAKERPRQ